MTLKEINLGANAIDGETLLELTIALVGIRSLKRLNLHGLHHVTANGWRPVLDALGSSPNSALDDLKLDINNIDDEGAVSFASALAGNNTLKVIDLDSTGISNVGRQAFSRLVCDKKSIMNTFSSNSTLYQICDSDGSSNFNEDLPLSLYLNQGSNKNDVVRHKILWAYFQGNSVDLKEFLGMGLKVMPRAFAWADRDYTGHSLLYQLLWTMPSLMELYHDHEPRAGGKKRKLAFK